MSRNQAIPRILIFITLLAVLTSIFACNRSDERIETLKPGQSTPKPIDPTDVRKWPSTTPEDVARKFTFAIAIGDEWTANTCARQAQEFHITARDPLAKEKLLGLAQEFKAAEFRYAAPDEQLRFLHATFRVPTDVGDDHKVLIQVPQMESKGEPPVFVELVRENGEWKVDAGQFVDWRVYCQAQKDRALRVNPERKKWCEDSITVVREVASMLKAIQDRASAEANGPKLKGAFLKLMDQRKQAGERHWIDIPYDENALFNTVLGADLQEVSKEVAAELQRVVEDKELWPIISPMLSDVDVDTFLRK